jgi:hypothetical protein
MRATAEHSYTNSSILHGQSKNNNRMTMCSTNNEAFLRYYEGYGHKANIDVCMMIFSFCLESYSDLPSYIIKKSLVNAEHDE